MSRSGKRRSKGGRPPLQAGLVRRYAIKVRLSERELSTVRAQAHRAQLPTATYVRRVILGKAVRPCSVPAVNLKAIAELHREGNNLNQLTKLLHEGRAPLGLATTLDNLLKLNEELRSLLTGGGFADSKGG